jgi:N utilization substance protein B
MSDNSENNDIENEHFGISSRRQAREAALQALYQSDSLSEWTKEKLESFFLNFYNLKPEDKSSNVNYEFSVFLSWGVVENHENIDKLIAGISHHWPIARMSRIDRNILRLATFELMNCKETPSNICISEALEVGKRFSSEESLIFINGVLDKVAKDIEELS